MTIWNRLKTFLGKYAARHCDSTSRSMLLSIQHERDNDGVQREKKKKEILLGQYGRCSKNSSIFNACLNAYDILPKWYSFTNVQNFARKLRSLEYRPRLRLELNLSPKITFKKLFYNYSMIFYQKNINIYSSSSKKKKKNMNYAISINYIIYVN
ncbi:hypothetical protein PUN28_002952 [Cardiocondyla obscurior]|uniref:Uncharacterized protein n=1 Tax=Cardiocondyla obscurior TaxID=286306 RepID=A0AAW2GWV5_9HYME